MAITNKNYVSTYSVIRSYVVYTVLYNIKYGNIFAISLYILLYSLSYLQRKRRNVDFNFKTFIILKLTRLSNIFVNSC